MKKGLLIIMFLLSNLVMLGQFTEGFESGIPADWSIINGGDTNTWNAGAAIGGAHTGTKVARIFYDDILAHNDYLITKQFTVSTNLSNRLSFS
jgi:Cleaved Adhesin Domain